MLRKKGSVEAGNIQEVELILVVIASTALFAGFTLLQNLFHLKAGGVYVYMCEGSTGWIISSATPSLLAC